MTFVLETLTLLDLGLIFRHLARDDLHLTLELTVSVARRDDLPYP